VRLAAKLLGWKIDIKSEEEKRQEVESAMAALVPAGAPVSVLIDHGLSEDIAEKLIEAGVATIEKLGSMTPEELEVIPGIGSAVVEKILVAVNAYYAPYEQSADSADDGESVTAAASAAESDPEIAASDGTGTLASETASTDSADSKTEFDTIKNSEEVS
jgi:N utilization substance protein A